MAHGETVLTPSAELRDAVTALAIDAVIYKIATWRALNGIAIKDDQTRWLERGWIYEATVWSYDKGIVGHNALVRQCLHDLGYVTQDKPDGEPEIVTLNTVGVS